MIKKYCFGKVIQTGAVVENLSECLEKIPYFTVEQNEKTTVFKYKMTDSDAVYGLGEQVRGINKRGWIYESKNMDDPIITENRTALYGAHNFFVIIGEKSFGVFLDCAGIVTYDIGFTNIEELIVTVNGGVNVYLVEGTGVLEIVREFRKLIGKSYIPPKWALGYGQSRWGYKCEEDIREVAENYKKANMPLDMIYLDIDYMQDYKDFSVNEERYPDLQGLIADMREQGIRLIPIIDAAVKVEEGYNVYEECVQKGYCCMDINGKPYIVGVWPGDSILPDVLNEDARKWFGEHYKFLLDKGAEGFWNDMNEPALFYSKRRIQSTFQKAADSIGKNLSLDEFWAVTTAMSGLANNVNDYEEMYHNVNGEKHTHAELHNLYGYNMTKAAAEYFKEYDPDKRYLLFSRSSSIGMHRYGGIWTGDNASWWSHLLLNLKMLPSLNMCGFLFVGADVGGFGNNTTEDLLLRWHELAVFIPLMRNHTTLNTRSQECYQFEKNRDKFRNVLQARYALIPYLYSELVKASVYDDMMFKPLSFVYTQEKRAKTVEDQLLVGDSIMIAPIYEQNAQGRYVWIPERMKMIRMKTGSEYTEKILEKGSYYIEMPLGEVVFFLREGKVIPLAKPANNVSELDENNLEWIKFINEPTEYEICKDGDYTGYDLKPFLKKVTVNV